MSYSLSAEKKMSLKNGTEDTVQWDSTESIFALHVTVQSPVSHLAPKHCQEWSLSPDFGWQTGKKEKRMSTVTDHYKL